MLRLTGAVGFHTSDRLPWGKDNQFCDNFSASEIAAPTPIIRSMQQLVNNGPAKHTEVVKRKWENLPTIWLHSVTAATPSVRYIAEYDLGRAQGIRIGIAGGTRHEFRTD